MRRNLIDGETLFVSRIDENQLFRMRANANQRGWMRREQSQKLVVIDDAIIGTAGLNDFNRGC